MFSEIYRHIRASLRAAGATVTLACALSAAQAQAPDPTALVSPMSVEPPAMRQCANPPEYPSQGPLHVKLHINQLKGAWGFAGVPPDSKDANGYPTVLPDGPAHSRMLDVEPAMSGIAPYTGRFRLYGQGIGTFRITRGRILKATGTLSLPRQSVRGQTYWYVDFDYDPSETDVRGLIEILDLPVRGDHLRDLALVHHSHLDAWAAGDIFMPEVIADLSLFGHGQAPRRGALRYMQMLHTNAVWTPGAGTDNTNQTEAMRDRRFVSPDHYSFTRIQNPDTDLPGHKLIPTAMPIADIVALANATGTDIWYNLSADILDARARDIARYVADHLDPDLRVFWEYGNELWNSARGFAGYGYARDQGRLAFPDLGEAAAVHEWDVYRGMQLFAQIREIFADRPEQSRYMASFWAMSPSNRPNGTLIEAGYAARYFAAEHARRKPDIGALPEDIITDMAVGGYFGGAFQAIATFIDSELPDDSARSAALVAIMLHGFDADPVVLDRAHLDAPLTGVPAEAPLAAWRLLRADLQDGVDPWSGIDRVLRLRDDRLEYRRLGASDWRTVAIFDAPPAAADVRAMVLRGQLVADGRRFYGEIVDGVNPQLRNVLEFRVNRHRAVAQRFGLDFHFYEGGPGSDNTPAAQGAVRPSFVRHYQDIGGADVLMARFLDRAAADVVQMCWYKSHNRRMSDYWGLKQYYGQPAADAAKWRAVERMARPGAQ